MRRLISSAALLPILVFASALLYLGYSVRYGYVGFPLDDAWIHQTYARNLGQHGQFAYNLGEPSMGSTSPLWTVLIAPAYALRLEPRLWTYLLGAVFLALTGWLLQRLGRQLSASGLLPLLTGAFCVLEWHLAWAAFSGMETIFFVFLSLLLLERHLAGERPLLVGFAGGLLTLTRPEGVMLFLIIAADAFWRPPHGATGLSWRGLRRSATLLAGFLVAVGPYLALNLSVTGNPLPNTFYAKQAEFQAATATLPVWARLAREAFVTVVGAQALLIPGFLYAAYKGVRERWRPILLPLAWWAALITIYALRLPVTYHHGRYVMPAIPVVVLLGVWGTDKLPRLHRIPKRVLLLSLPILLFVFWVRGAQQYATDVRIIDSELKGAGLWIRDHTPDSALIGVHDIGAIGYFSERRLIDIAGLITPEVIPFIRNEERVLAFLEEKHVDYVAIFPSWYPTLANDSRLRIVYRSTNPWIVEAGGDNIAVYETAWCQACLPVSGGVRHLWCVSLDPVRSTVASPTRR
jgi:arabinofuranosyltransferase